MNRQQISKAKARIASLFEQRRLKEVFEQLNTLIKSNNSWTMSEKLIELESNYSNLIHYFVEGQKDPNHNKIYNQLLRETLNLSDDVFEGMIVQNSTSMFFEKMRLANIRPNISMEDYRDAIDRHFSNLAVIDLLKEGDEKNSSMLQSNRDRELIVREMFYSVFSSPRANSELIASYRDFVNDERLPINDRCMLISALAMNMLYRFDYRKIEFLLELCENQIPEFSIRAIVSVIPIFQIHTDRWQLYPELESRLKVMADNPTFERQLMTAIIQYIQAHETEKITKIITEDIMPEIARLNPIAGKKIELDEWMEESGFEEKNPEWQKMMEDSELNSKLREFSEIQQSGADVFHSTFSKLKTYPFFNDMCNWFLPFDPQYSLIQELFTGKKYKKLDSLKSLLDLTFMCNSDKYSFCLSLIAMPEEYRSKLTGGIEAQNEELREAAEDSLPTSTHQQEEMICKQYVQDIYRFFKLHTYAPEDNIDIFALPLNYHDIKAFTPVVAKQKNLERIALYYFEKNNFAEAADTYGVLLENDGNRNELWQKMGYSKQMTGDIASALEAYRRADLIEDNNTWVIRRIAQCYRLLKQNEDALTTYRRLEHLRPDDLNVQLNIGHCHLELKQYEQALNYYFKVELLDANNARAWRSIAWCAFLSRKFDVARRYYKLIIESKPNEHDLLNAGHVELCEGDIKQAIDLYRQSLRKANSPSEFRNMMLADRNELKEAGIAGDILSIIIDKVQYDEQPNH